MNKVLLSVLALALLILPAFAGLESNRKKCMSSNPEWAMDGCATIIDNGWATRDDRAWAYSRRAKALINMGRYREAIKDLEEALHLYPNSFHSYQESGRAHFYLGDFAAAAQDFEPVVRSRSVTEYDVLWRYLAIARSGEDGRKLLQSDVGKFDLSAWPGFLMEMFLGKRDPQSALAAAQSNKAQLQSENLCEAYFYIGQYYLLHDQIDAAKNAFRQALDTNAYTFVEYRGAYEELKRLGEAFPADDPRLKILFPQGVK